MAAFCGLGNPEYFWCTLAALGLQPALSIEFEDHHAYKPRELRYISDHFRDERIEASNTLALLFGSIRVC